MPVFRTIQARTHHNKDVNMTAFSTKNLASSKLSGFNARQRQRSLNLQAFSADRAVRIGRVSAGRSSLRVLIIDDGLEAMTTLIKLIRGWGHAADRIHDACTALQVAASQQPELVLLDLETPFMDGCQVGRQLRVELPTQDCLIVAVATAVDGELRQQSVDAGIDMVLSKPIDLSVIETLLVLECIRADRRRKRQTRSERYRVFGSGGGSSC
jgi:CheY-like chemotaxis protein